MNINLIQKIVSDISIKCDINNKSYIFNKQLPIINPDSSVNLVDSIDNTKYKFTTHDSVTSISLYGNCYPTFRELSEYDEFISKKKDDIIINNNAFDKVISNLRKIAGKVYGLDNRLDKSEIYNKIKKIPIKTKNYEPVITTKLNILCLSKNIPKVLSLDDLESIFSPKISDLSIDENIKSMTMDILLSSKESAISNLITEKKNNPTDTDLHDEIDVIISLINESVIPTIFDKSTTTTDLINSWPSILLPVPFK